MTEKTAREPRTLTFNWNVARRSRAAQATDFAETLIQPSPGWPRFNFPELLAYRGLFFFLVWRDIKVRYAQTVMGVGWAVLVPVLQMIVFSLIFGGFAKIPSDGLPYPVFSLTGVVAFNYFSTSLTGSSNSLVVNRNLITKVYFPRLVVPFAPVLAGLVDFAIAFTVLLIVMLAFGITPGWQVVPLLPFLVLAMMATAAGVGCWLSALNIQYRDVKYIVPFLTQVWMFGSPVIYPMSLVPERYQAFYALNPMAGVIEAFRAVLFGKEAVDVGMIGLSLGVGLLVLFTGAVYFRRTERVFADVA